MTNSLCHAQNRTVCNSFLDAEKVTFVKSLVAT